MRVSFSRVWRWLCRRPAPPEPVPDRPPRPREWTAAGLTMDDATELLDLLERRGGRVVEVAVDSDARVTIRWMA